MRFILPAFSIVAILLASVATNPKTDASSSPVFSPNFLNGLFKSFEIIAISGNVPESTTPIWNIVLKPSLIGVVFSKITQPVKYCKIPIASPPITKMSIALPKIPKILIRAKDFFCQSFFKKT